MGRPQVVAAVFAFEKQEPNPEIPGSFGLVKGGVEKEFRLQPLRVVWIAFPRL